jgi:hypothetical protein
MAETQGVNPNLESYKSIIAVPSHVDPQIPPHYWGTDAGTILAVAVLIRSLAVLIQVLVPLLGRKPDAKVSSR